MRPILRCRLICSAVRRSKMVLLMSGKSLKRRSAFASPVTKAPMLRAQSRKTVVLVSAGFSCCFRDEDSMMARSKTRQNCDVLTILAGSRDSMTKESHLTDVKLQLQFIVLGVTENSLQRISRGNSNEVILTRFISIIRLRIKS